MVLSLKTVFVIIALLASSAHARGGLFAATSTTRFPNEAALTAVLDPVTTKGTNDFLAKTSLDVVRSSFSTVFFSFFNTFRGGGRN
jgi:hypothetical protein